jgi:CRISPR-associated protein Cas1
MPTLTLMEQGTTLAVKGEVFAVEREGQLVQELRMADVDEVLLFGSIMVTPAAIAALLQRGIDTVFLTAHGRYRGRLVGKPGKNVPLRLAQFDRLRDPAVTIPLARAIVAGKVANQRYVMLRAQREQKREGLAEAIGGLRRMLEAVEAAESIEALRGVEGKAAALYFASFGKCLRNPQFTFVTRNRRRPRDPMNAMLSFGYTLLGMQMEAAVLRVGLDPMVGVFHAPDYGRPSLMLDLIEEFRPILVDALILRIVNRREVAPEDFEELHDDAEIAGVEDTEGEAAEAAGKAVWLGPTGRRIYFRAWGRRLRETHFYPIRRQTLTLEEIMQQQVYQLARVITGEQDTYQPFVVR